MYIIFFLLLLTALLIFRIEGINIKIIGCGEEYHKDITA